MCSHACVCFWLCFIFYLADEDLDFTFLLACKNKIYAILVFFLTLTCVLFHIYSFSFVVCHFVILKMSFAIMLSSSYACECVCDIRCYSFQTSVERVFVVKSQLISVFTSCYSACSPKQFCLLRKFSTRNETEWILFIKDHRHNIRKKKNINRL